MWGPVWSLGFIPTTIPSGGKESSLPGLIIDFTIACVRCHVVHYIISCFPCCRPDSAEVPKIVFFFILMLFQWRFFLHVLVFLLDLLSIGIVRMPTFVTFDQLR